MNCRNDQLRCWLVLLGLTFQSAALAAPGGNPVAPVPLPAGITDQAGKVGYVSGAKGGIEAIDLESGEVLWEAKEPARPLVVWDKLLIAQADSADKANAVRILVLDITQKGKRVLESDPVTFPEWVSVGVTYGRSFSSQARVHNGELLLRWRANAFYAGGAAPTPEILEAAKKEASGVAQVNLESGKVAMLPAEKAPPDPKGKLPEQLAKKVSLQYWTGSDWKTDLFVVGNTVSALDVQAPGGVATMSLKRWDLTTGKPLDTVELLRGKELWPQVSIDGQHVFVHQALVKEQLPPGDYAWWVFSLETGKQLCKLPYEGPLNNVTVVGTRALFLVGGQRLGPRPGNMVQPRSLRALDLKTGKVAWERPVEGVKVLLPLP
jgi:PQQ enzyme repeat